MAWHGMAKNPAHRPPGAHQFVTLLEQHAVSAYGPDWERRGWIALGAATAVLATAFPAAALGLTSGASGLAYGAAHLAGKVGAKGLFGKATGPKVGGGLVATAVAATKPIVLPTTETDKLASRHDQGKCVELKTSTSTLTFTIPKKDTPAPGAYQLSPIGRPRITDIEVGPKRSTFVDPAVAGAQAEGSLPRIGILS
jgi:hypothetical protein